MPSKAVQDLVNLGAIAVGDRLVAERVDGTTVRVTYTPKTITGTTDKITVANGDSVSGDPTITIASTYSGQTSITTLGTISSGIWNGTPIANSYIANTAVANLSGVNTGDQTNIPGNAATVTTNANLTGPITSVGNATSVASQTGTGSKFVMDTSPTLVTPNIGTPSAGALTNCTSIPAEQLTGTVSVNRFNSGTGASTSTYLRGDGTWVTPSVGSGTINSSTANNLTYYSGTSTLSGITTANNGILVTSGSGVPSIGNTIGAGITLPSVTFNSTTEIVGTTTNNNAAAGSVGEVLSTSATSVAITNNTLTNVLSQSLTAGDWDVYASVSSNPAGGTTTSSVSASISTTSATHSTPYMQLPYTVATGTGTRCTLSAYPVRLSLASTTTVYLVSTLVYSGSTSTIDGYLYARRRR
jgi:hypothetical protein